MARSSSITCELTGDAGVFPWAAGDFLRSRPVEHNLVLSLVSARSTHQVAEILEYRFGTPPTWTARRPDPTRTSVILGPSREQQADGGVEAVGRKLVLVGLVGLVVGFEPGEAIRWE